MIVAEGSISLTSRRQNAINALPSLTTPTLREVDMADLYLSYTRHEILERFIVPHIHFELTGGCWHWDGAVNAQGYGNFRTNRKTYSSHRVIYELTKGPIPLGFHIDHLCRNTSCCNPDHLEAVTVQENVKRSWQRGRVNHNATKTHCYKGHKYTANNTYYQPSKTSRDGLCRVCHTCMLLRQDKRRRAKGVSARSKRHELWNG